MLEVRFNNVNREHQIIEQPNIVQGSKDSIPIVISFGTYSGGNFVPTLQYTESSDIQVGAIYTRPDGDKSWFIPFEKQIDGTFTSVLSDWVTRENGVLNIDVQVKNIVTGTTNPFTRIKQTILEGTALSGDDWEFGEADYDAIINTQLSHDGRILALEMIDAETRLTEIENVKIPRIDQDVLDLQTNKADKTYVDAQDVAVLQQAKDYTYDKQVIDNKDANTLQQAKDYTYSKVEIDNKDTTIMNKKVDKTTTIIGLDLQDNILIGEFRTALGNATQSVAGLLSAEDKTHLDGLVALLETNDGNNVVDTIGEILEIFQNYPEGADLVTVLQGKVDKVVGKGLSTNDFTDFYKAKLEEMITFMGFNFIYIDGGMFITTPTISISGGDFIGFEPQGIIEGGNFI